MRRVAWDHVCCYKAIQVVEEFELGKTESIISHVYEEHISSLLFGKLIIEASLKKALLAVYDFGHVRFLLENLLMLTFRSLSNNLSLDFHLSLVNN